MGICKGNWLVVVENLDCLLVFRHKKGGSDPGMPRIIPFLALKRHTASDLRSPNRTHHPSTVVTTSLVILSHPNIIAVFEIPCLNIPKAWLTMFNHYSPVWTRMITINVLMPNINWLQLCPIWIQASETFMRWSCLQIVFQMGISSTWDDVFFRAIIFPSENVRGSCN